ncbi:MAG: threonine synthase [Chloroflexi bacterium]|nr:threonine synthase [Chloroflexota bacterium]
MTSDTTPRPPFLSSLRCLRCGTEYAPDAIEYVCACRPNVGSDLGTLDVEYDYAAIRSTTSPEQIGADPDRSIGRWWAQLPVQRESLPPLPVGNTPLLHAKRLGESIGLPNLYVKDDGRNPSASFKDRASAIAVARAQEKGSAVVATASTGNAAAALAGQAAAAGQASVIFVPKTAPKAKIAQLLVYGSRVLAVDGSYDDAFDLCVAACAEFGWYNRNTGYNPYMTEGKKTVAFEIVEQLSEFRDRSYELGARSYDSAPLTHNSKLITPNSVFVSVGDGCIIGGVHKGFNDLLALGWIERMPRIYGVQSAGSPALYNAWRDGREIPLPVAATTRADSISVNAPRDPVKALNAVRQSGGAFVLVEDTAILASILPLARLGAVFAEPAGAAAYAGLQRALADGLVGRDETVILINTGSGLKDVPAAMQMTGEPLTIPPTLAAVHRVLQTINNR